MRNVFVETSNVREFYASLKKLNERGAEEACMVVVDGKPGLGKTTTLNRWVTQTGSVYLRAQKGWDYGWFIQELLAELSVDPKSIRGKRDRFARVLSELQDRADRAALRDRTFGIVIDECDLVSSRGEIMEAIRGISDLKFLPTILVGINPCKIGDVVGTLAWTGSSYADMTGTWTFTRAVAGSAVQITRPTAIRTEFDINRRGGIQIIFMGQNGGYSSNDDLVRQHRLMMEHSTAKHTIILGLSSGSAAARADYEAAMRLAFGRYFIPLREYLATPIYTNGVITSCYGLEDAGLTPTQADLDAIATGTVPPQLLADAVHYTAATKTVIGNLIYARMRDLNVV